MFTFFKLKDVSLYSLNFTWLFQKVGVFRNSLTFHTLMWIPFNNVRDLG